MTSNVEADAPATGTKRAPRASKTATVAPREPRVTPAKGKATQKAGTATKAAKAPKVAKQAKPAAGAREGSKTAQILDLLRRPGGASLKDLMEVSGWQAHSVRGFLSGTVGKKLGLAVSSTKGEDGERIYSVKA